MQPASSASPRLRTWFVLGVSCLIGAATAFAISGRRAVPAMPAMPEVTGETAEPVHVPERATEQAAPIAIVGVASRTRITRGQPLPLTFYVVNRTTHSLPVLRSLDASDFGWRYPKLDLEIRDAKGHLVMAEGGRCGLVNPLAKDDFVDLASGARTDLLGDGTFGHYKLRDTSYLPAGRYTVTLRYDLSFAEPERGKGMPVEASVRAKIETLPKGVYSSEPITIDVR